MVREFKLPDVGEGVAEGELVSWLVEEGDEVTEDQPVAEVETDKALVEVPSPVDGTVSELHYAEGDVIPVGNVFVTFALEGEDAETAEPDSGSASADEETEPTTDAESAPTDEESEAGSPGAIGADTEETGTPQDRVFVPPRLRRKAREDGLDLSSVRGSGPGGRITAADIRAASAADDGGQETPDSGSSDTETAGDSSDTVDDRAGTEATPTTSSVSGATSAPSTDLEDADREQTLAAPATRRIAEEEGVNIDAVPAVEERDGQPFVTPDAVREYAEAKRQGAESEGLEAGGAADATGVDFSDGERERREPFAGVRKRTADAMVESKFTAPHVTHHDEVDVTALVEAREDLKPRAADRGIRLTYMPFIVKAVVAALKEYPEMNAVIDDDAEEIVYRDYYNVGIATATDAGLLVPVVENADQQGLLALASSMNELVQKARERTVSPTELQGSTFTVTNVGGIGGEYATPILNYPEAGILAVGEIKRKPRVVTDEEGTETIEPRSVLTLSLSFDHRLIDGAIGAQFMNTVMESLENPHLLLLE
ncbi:dihydrolipoamide acetyltransferase family protein [Natronorubrum daqingense]|uniref:Branched-chain alpha-keto acid dehydrogenase subunit E2 n=1 Tax=Natronorubrum daqingense TaxID=588898 RepID=A0A1N7F0Q8_9EURY|nr:dihydrolipoamide acetyltransferase family protein [Natronorubrum daqingense]APX97453.1 branched-chain alpha-keto acid dehydrogenase subunit E2 [Natronorubrum daqingense]SIR93785.1 pyruvate dehydrogenase E2 component (dihydrolipoamide acetyltransferase) [Natronorubrum daqingense]